MSGATGIGGVSNMPKCPLSGLLPFPALLRTPCPVSRSDTAVINAHGHDDDNNDHN